MTADAVADEAVALRAWDIEAGKFLREKWENAGLRAEFQTPLALIDEIFGFWWSHRDALTEDDRIIESLRGQVEALKAQLTPSMRRQQAAAAVFQSILAAVIVGQSPTPESVSALQDAANRWAEAI